MLSPACASFDQFSGFDAPGARDERAQAEKKPTHEVADRLAEEIFRR